MKLIWIAAFALVSCLARGAEPTREQVIEEGLGGADAVRLIAEARTVQMWRLVEAKIFTAPAGLSGKPISEQTAEDEARDAAVFLRASFAPIGDGLKLDQTQVDVLKKLLISPASYTGPRYSPEGKRLRLFKGCAFTPVARVLFSSGDDEIEVWICFGCTDLVVLRKEKRLGGGEFKPSRHELLTLVQSVLKDDPVIMKIGAR